MGAADGIWFVCPECGASNRPANKSCFLCGHDLDSAAPDTRAGAARSPIVFSSVDAVDPYEPPPGVGSTPRTFRISSLLLLIAVIAVCLGVFHEQPVLGIILAVAVTPAMAYTMIVAAKSEARGRPLATIDKISTFLAAIVGVVIIAFSALVAFVSTCFPAGFIGMNVGGAGIIFAVVIGATAGIAAAVYTTRFLLTRKHRRI